MEESSGEALCSCCQCYKSRRRGSSPFPCGRTTSADRSTTGLLECDLPGPWGPCPPELLEDRPSCRPRLPTRRLAPLPGHLRSRRRPRRFARLSPGCLGRARPAHRVGADGRVHPRDVRHDQPEHLPQAAGRRARPGRDPALFGSEGGLLPRDGAGQDHADGGGARAARRSDRGGRRCWRSVRAGCGRTWI